MAFTEFERGIMADNNDKPKNGYGHKRTIKEMQEEWKVIKQKKEVMLKIEETITEHQAFIFSILRDRIEEVKTDFQRKAMTYWKLDEVINFLDKEANRYGFESYQKRKENKIKKKTKSR